MAFDSTTFASDFADLFGNFAEQQKEQNENIVSALEQVGSNVGVKKGFKEKAKEFANEAQEKYLGGRPKTGPRQVKKAAIGVVIEDVSNKAAIKLKTSIHMMEDEEEAPPETKMGLLALLGGLLGAGAVGVIGSVFGKGAGAGVAAGLLTKIGPMIFKPLKVVLKRLPIIGSLFSFYEAYENFKKGGVDNILLGLLDVAAGFAYAFPGVGTAIGLGIDVLSYFINKRVEEHKVEGGDTSWLGSMYDKVIDYLSETDQIKWMMSLSDLFSVLWDDPSNLDNWYNFFTHIGGLGTGLIDMLMNFDKTVGTALGITDEKGEGAGLVAEIVKLVNFYIVDPLIGMITDAFDYIKTAIGKAASVVTDSARNIFSTLTFGLVDDADTAKQLAEKEKQNAEMESQLMYEGLLNKKFKDLSDEEKKMRQEIESDPNSDRFKQYEKDLKAAREGPSSSFGTDAKPLLDFAVIGGEIVELPKTAILAGGKVQAFSGNDTIIGFKEGEALLEGMKNLISVGQQQLTVLQEYLLKDGNNIIAPNTNNNSTYNFSVESGVTSFRKMVS
jgi:hypothetical protein